MADLDADSTTSLVMVRSPPLTSLAPWSHCSATRWGKNWRRWRGTVTRGKSRRLVEPDRPEHSRRSARSPLQQAFFDPLCAHLADRVGSRLRAKSRLGRTVSVRVRFADLRAVTRSVTLPAPISATATLAEIAEDLVR